MVIKWHLHTVVLQRRSKAERPLASQISSLEMCCFDGPVALVLSFRSELVAVFEEAGRKSAISVCVCVLLVCMIHAAVLLPLLLHAGLVKLCCCLR